MRIFFFVSFYVTSFDAIILDFLCRFLTKLLTVDLPRLFVRPNKIVLDFQKGKAVGPVPNNVKTGEMSEGNKDCVGELSVTLVDARKLPYIFYGITLFSCICSVNELY